jgi:hypothetical protein
MKLILAAPNFAFSHGIADPIDDYGDKSISCFTFLTVGSLMISFVAMLIAVFYLRQETSAEFSVREAIMSLSFRHYFNGKHRCSINCFRMHQTHSYDHKLHSVLRLNSNGTDRAKELDTLPLQLELF